MAEAMEELMFRIRLAEDELNQQFIQVSQTVKQNLERINRERNLIDIQANIDLSGLDRATDATEIFEVQQRRLQRQIELQQSRVQILSAVLRDTAQRTGENSEETQRAQIRYEQARLSVARYERQLRELNAAQEESGVSSSKMLDAINKVGTALRNWGEIQEVIAAMAAGVVALTEKFKELEKVAYDFNLPFDKAREFADKVKLAGGDLEDIGGFLRGLTDAIVKGEVDDPEWITLEKYDAQILDATGRLKDYAEIMEELHKAYLKAKDAGEEVEFLQMLGGESGVTDAMQIMERWGDATADASKVVKAALDPAELQQSERAINLLTLQLGELMDALSNFLSPTTAQTAETLFEIANSITAWLVDNKDLIKETGWELARLFGAVPDIPFELANKALLDTSESADKLRNSLAKLNKEGEGKGSDKNPLSQYGIQRTNQFRDEIEDIRLEIDYLDEYQRKLAQLDLWRDRELYGKIFPSDEEQAAIEELFWIRLEQIEQEKEDRVAEIREQAERARRTDLENTLADIEREKEKRISAGMAAAEAIELAAQESAAAIRDVEDAFTEKVTSFRNSALQNQYDAIDKERDDWIKKGVDPERANAFADEQRYKALQDLEESFSAAVNDIRASDLEKQLARIEQEKQAWIDKGIEEARAEELANEQKAQVLQDYADKQQQAEENYVKQVKQREEQIAKIMADYRKRVAESMERQFDDALSVLKSQLDAFKAYRDDGIKGLEEYDRKQLKKQGITDKDLESMTKGNLDDFNQAQKDIKRNLLPNFQPVNDVPFPELPPIETPQAFADLNSEIYRATDALENFAETADGKRYYLNEPNLDIPNYTPQVDNADFYPDLNTPLNDLSKDFAGITQGLNDTTRALSDMTSAIAQVGTPSKFNDYPQTAQNQTVNVNVTVQIEEAHAWDSQHIQELADRVADRIEPEIVNAIGSDSNSY